MAAVPHHRFCACCTAPAVRAPAFIWNRPGLAAIGYRIGTFATFRQAMLQEIHTFPELTGLRTREPDDHAITLLDLFAALGDVLTFYNERIVNEMFLDQALHKASIEQLVALLGYRPRPALSATGLLSFQIEDDKATRVWKGLKVMSVPGPDETAQVFETLEEIAANDRLNAAPAFAPFVPINALRQGSRRAPITSSVEGLNIGDRFVLYGRGVIEDKEITGLETTPGGTYLNWSAGVQNPDFHSRLIRAAKAERRLRFYGHDAPASRNIYDTDSTTPPQQRWRTVPISGQFGSGQTEYPLDAVVDDLKPGAHLLFDAGPSAEPRIRTAVVVETSDKAASLDPLSATVAPLSDTVTYISVRQTIIGRPTVATPSTGQAIVLARSGGGQPSILVDAPPELRVFDDPAPFASSDIAALSSPPARFDVFVRDAALRLQRWTLLGAPTGWISHGGALSSPPVPVALAGGQIRVFVRGLDLRLWMFDATGAVTSPVSLGGILSSAPAAVSPDGTTIAVFVRGIDNALWLKFFDGAAWQAWEPLGGSLAGTPSAAVSGAGNIHVYCRGRGGGLRHIRRTAMGWEEWRELGGDVDGDPVAVAGAPDWSAAVVRTSEETAAFVARVGDTWTDWIDQGGSIASDPSATVDGSGVQIAARHTDGSLATAQLALSVPQWTQRGDGLGHIPDRRQTRIYEIGEGIAFREYDYPATASGGWLALPLGAGEDATDADRLGALKKNRRIILSAGSVQHSATVAHAFAIPSTPGDDPDHLAVGFAPPLPETAGPITLLGNVAKASHGETQREDALGNGDATHAFQRFSVPPGEITHLPETTGVRPVPQVELRADDVLWEEVAHLYGRSPKDRAYTLRMPTDHDPVITGGDGVRAGARFPTGALNIRLTRRLGAGLAGNLKAGQLSTALDKAVGMRAVSNPLATSGGADGESAEDVRKAAPNGVRTFGRIVSLADFAALATASGLAARAHVTWVWNRWERTAHLTVAGPGGAPLSHDNLALLHAQLTNSRDPNRRLMMANMVRVPIVVTAKLLRDPAYESDLVASRAQQALLEVFAFEAVEMGRAVHLSEIHAALQAVTGVVAVDVDLLHLRDHDDLSADERAVRSVTAAPVQPHIRLYSARPTPADPADIDRYQKEAYEPGPLPAVLPAEQAFIADGARDLKLTVVEAL